MLSRSISLAMRGIFASLRHALQAHFGSQLLPEKGAEFQLSSCQEHLGPRPVITQQTCTHRTSCKAPCRLQAWCRTALPMLCTWRLQRVSYNVFIRKQVLPFIHFAILIVKKSYWFFKEVHLSICFVCAYTRVYRVWYLRAWRKLFDGRKPAADMSK